MSEIAITLLALALSAFTSATLLPGASEVALLAVATAGSASPWLLLAVAAAGNVAGSCVNWVLGRFLIRFSDRRWFPASPRQVDRASHWYRRYGWPSLLLSWLPIVGDPLTVVAGALRTPFALFLVVVGIAKTARYALLLWLAGFL